MNALAIVFLSVVPTADRATSADDLSKAITELKSGETKLKSTYQEVVQGYKKVGPIMKQIGDVNHDVSELQAKALSIAGQGQGYNGRRAEANARNALQNRIKDLEKQKKQLENELKSKMGPVEEQENAFRDEEKKIWEATNKSLVPILYVLKIGDDRKAFDSVMSIFDLFIFDDHKDTPHMKLGSVLDQEVLGAIGKCLATSGSNFVTNLRKSLDKSIAIKYASVIAVTEIGPDAAKADKDVTSGLNEIKAALLKNKSLPKAERDARLKLVEKAIDATRK